MLRIGVQVCPAVFLVKFSLPDVQGKEARRRKFGGGCFFPVRWRKGSNQVFRIHGLVADRLPCQAEAGDYVRTLGVFGVDHEFGLLGGGGKIVIFPLQFP